eukprot:jgi/Phyca11/21871/fgenesh1_pg.PHYCAscaffold_174_\
MQKATDETTGAGATAPPPEGPVAGRERIGMADDAEEQSTAQPQRADHTTEDLIAIVQGMSKQLQNMKEAYEKMTESQNKAHAQMEADARLGRAQRLGTPPMNSGLFESDLGRGSRMRIDALGGSPRTPSPTAQRRAVAPPQYFGHQQPGYGMPVSRLQRLYAEEQQERDRAAAERAAQALAVQHAQAHAAPAPQQPPPAQAGPAGIQQQQGAVRYPDARQKKLAIRPFDGKELYVGLGSGFLEWGKRFERQVNIAQSACGFLWPEDVKVDL